MNAEPPAPVSSLHPGRVRSLLTEFLREETRKAGFSNAVLGLSGGVDSSVVAFLAQEALGGDHVTGVIMPYATSSPASRRDAEEVARRLALRTQVVDISPMVDAYLAVAGPVDRVRAGNVMARQRMIVLYDLSAREQALVLGTSNRTEILLGYGTLYGDTACALNPLGDLYKTEVWDLARTLGVPEEIIRKRPSADLWDGQADEDELGITYGEADRILYYMMEEGLGREEMIGRGLLPRLVDRVAELVRKNTFKSRPPLIARIRKRAAGGA